MRRKIMHRMAPPRLRILIPLPPVVPQRPDPHRTFLAVKVDSREHHSHRIDAVRNVVLTYDPGGFEAETVQRLRPTLPTRQLPHLRVMRQDVPLIHIRLVAQYPRVILQTLATALYV